MARSYLTWIYTLRVPIIANTPFEEDLADSMAAAMEKYPEAAAILVMRHGPTRVRPAAPIFLQGISDVDFPGDNWQKVKAQAEVPMSSYWIL